MMILFLLLLWRRSIRFYVVWSIESYDASIMHSTLPIQPPTTRQGSKESGGGKRMNDNIIWLQMWREGCSITPTKWIPTTYAKVIILLLQFACPSFIILVGVHKLRRVSARKEHFRSRDRSRGSKTRVVTVSGTQHVFRSFEAGSDPEPFRSLGAGSDPEPAQQRQPSATQIHKHTHTMMMTTDDCRRPPSL